MTATLLASEENAVVELLKKATCLADVKALVPLMQTHPLEGAIYLNGLLKYMKNPLLPIRQHEFVALLKEFQAFLVHHLQTIKSQENAKEIVSCYLQNLEIRIEIVLGLAESIDPEVILSNGDVLQKNLFSEGTNSFLVLIKDMAIANAELSATEQKKCKVII